MRVHPRTSVVNHASRDLARLTGEWIKEHDLTYVEAVRCLLERTQELTTYVLRAERHPRQPGRKADEE